MSLLSCSGCNIDHLTLQLRLLFLLILLCLSSPGARADSYCDAVAALDLTELAAAFDAAAATRLLAGHGAELRGDHRRAAAVLIAAGILEPADADQPDAAAWITAESAGMTAGTHPGLKGRIGDTTTLAAMQPRQSHAPLLAATEFLDLLGELLAEGVITGYDLRQQGVYDDFSAPHSLIYSHASWRHLRQLLVLLASEGVDGWIFVTPKVSAFLYRDGWGGSTAGLVRLPDGSPVVQAQEMATLFVFDDPADQLRFHELITRYAKKDASDEAALLADSWWQPFYYAHRRLEGFQQIALVVVTSAEHEATLTVLPENTGKVVAALAASPWPVRVDDVWVNPPFYRFLKGDFK